MNLYVSHCIAIVLLLINFQKICQAAVFGGVGIAGIVIAAGAAGKWSMCYFQECCTDKWIRPATDNKSVILDIFEKRLFGQHLVMQVVPSAIHNHIFDDNPKKALVMSFHGWTGCGKNFVADLIATYIYREGLNSEFYSMKISSEHYPDPNNIEMYKKELKAFIQSKTKACSRSLFIFDEMDKMPPGLADVLKNYIDFHNNVDGIDYRKNIFIFLNNIGGDEISEVALQNFYAGNMRESITTKTMENILSLNALKQHGGFENSDLILSGLVDFFIPFLPMEQTHVKQCASAEIERRIINSQKKGEPMDDELRLDRDKRKSVAEKVVNELHFFPKGENIFARTGCKQVAKKVDMFF